MAEAIHNLRPIGTEFRHTFPPTAHKYSYTIWTFQVIAHRQTMGDIWMEEVKPMSEPEIIPARRVYIRKYDAWGWERITDGDLGLTVRIIDD